MNRSGYCLLSVVFCGIIWQEKQKHESCFSFDFIREYFSCTNEKVNILLGINTHCRRRVFSREISRFSLLPGMIIIRVRFRELFTFRVYILYYKTTLHHCDKIPPRAGNARSFRSRSCTLHLLTEPTAR